MEKDYDEEVEEIDDELEQELTKEELELLEIEKEQSTKLKNGQVEFKNVNHSERAAKFGRVSDGDTTKYVNIALEYFGHRCALSGERFESFDKKVDGKKSNLSAEHVVALCLGGDDIVPNIVPTVLQYNLRKNGYYLLDYWDKQKDTEGKGLYSPYRLLKLVNYMMKSIEARDLKSIKDYRKAIMTPNEIDEFLAEIEQQDELEPDNNIKKIYSDTMTSTTIDEDNKKILTEVPQVEGNIPTQREQLERFRQNEIDMMDIFLVDAIGLLNRTQELQQIRLKDQNGNKISLQDKLNEMLKLSIGVIPFEVEVRNAILEKLESLGVQDNKYSVANDLLNNTEILELSKQNRDDVSSVVEDYIEKQLARIREKQVLNEVQLSTVISNMPTILYNEKEMSKIKLWSTYRSGSFEEFISGNYTATDSFIDLLIILKKNGVNLVYLNEKGKTKNTIKHEDTIGTILENYRPKLSEENKEKIKEELKEININDNIGNSLNFQKTKINIEQFTKELEKLREQLEITRIKLSEEEINALIERQQRSDNPMQVMINTIRILKQSGMNLVYRAENGKQNNTILRTDTIETMLENYRPRLTEEEKEKIERKLKEANTQKNIGNSLGTQKTSANIQMFIKELEKLKEELKQDAIEFSQEEINSLTGKKQQTQDATQDMIKAIGILKRNGINLVYNAEDGKIKNTIKAKDTIDTILEDYRPKLTEKEKMKIRRELKEANVNERIGGSLRGRKGKDNIEKFRKELEKLKKELGQKEIELTEEEINVLIERQTRENPTQDMINAIRILKQNGMNLVYIGVNGKQKNTILRTDTIETMLERYPNLPREQKEKIQKELEKLGINANIGNSLGTRKISANIQMFIKELEKLKEELEQDAIEFSQEEINSLIGKKQQSQDATQDMIKAIGILKRNGINLVYNAEDGKIKNTIKAKDTIETMLENYRPKLAEEEKKKIRIMLKEANIQKNIGNSLGTQKTSNNIPKFIKELEKLKGKLGQEEIELTEEEINVLIGRQTRENPTQDMINAIRVLKQNGMNLVYIEKMENQKIQY